MGQDFCQWRALRMTKNFHSAPNDVQSGMRRPKVRFTVGKVRLQHSPQPVNEPCGTQAPSRITFRPTDSSIDGHRLQPFCDPVCAGNNDAFAAPMSDNASGVRPGLLCPADQPLRCQFGVFAVAFGNVLDQSGVAAFLL